MKDLEIKYIECACGHTDHVLRFCYFPNDKDEIYIHIQLPLNKWYKRLRLGIRYIFGYQSSYGHWSETLLNSEGIKELKAFIEEFERK